MLSFECIKNEKSVYFLLTSATGSFLVNYWAACISLSNLLPNSFLAEVLSGSC